ncbi:P-loop containing nucleoside triphosphate hydrolase protein [Cristinia sonorae]|uniref:P-loop containing nucleoside triphosphate hydrolase protein n=1 Tax=Cristinia sonorae TaxID=1940300 RepID=A0A8K0UXD1_9AGAR|nr:P-loop containing nucleoside triphosphate hydrolase protein [Cristinia sonorae]
MSSMFGEPSGLLRGETLLDTPQAIGSQTLVASEESGEDAFVLGGLLGSEEGEEQMDEGFGEATLLTDAFHPTGLLSEGVTDCSASSQSLGCESQPIATQASQDLPDFRDAIGKYSTTTNAIRSTTSVTPSPAYTPPLRATTYNGKAVFIRKRQRKVETMLSSSSSNNRPHNIGKLLDVPMHRLMDEVSASVAAKLSIHDQPLASTSCAAGAESSMWVDRYRPQRYIDLVGDDRVHREVMAWVKEWDFCVFGNKKGKKKARDDGNLDEYRRPNEKLLLISGPPGLGKTTLAHIVAKQAGYNIFEINASDARSASVVDDRIRPAVESGSMVGSSKPTLVVIDEIDGATGGSDNSGGFIHKLVTLTQEIPKKGRKKEQQAVRPLLRPIICICNDLYASSLAKLRPHARIVRFTRPNDVHLVRRLRTICEQEGLKAESRALSSLVGLAQGDWRGCLNALQLIGSRSREVTELIVRKATTGMKEADMSQLAVLNDLFTPMSRKRAKDLGITEDEESKYVTRLCREVESSGAMDRIATGCFEHYATLRRHDANFSRYLKANEWLSTYDIMSGQMWAEREYASMQYLPYMLVGFYPLFQERGAPKMERPKVDWEQYTLTKTNEEIYKSLARGLRVACTRHGGAYRHFTSDTILQLEFAPFINRIISPPLRPVNKQVIKADEKALLSRLVDIMVSLELRFIQDKSEDGQLMYRLDPPIDVFVTYDGKRASDISVSRYAVRHLVASEIDAKFIHRDAEFTEKSKATNPKKRSFFNANKNDAAANGGDGMLMAKDADVPIAKRAKKDVAIEDKVAVDFFGRPIVHTASSKPVSSKGAKKEGVVAYRFREGNSAAVRKPVKVSSFL